jgi:ribosomal protection tetracycline resistance protein
MSRTIRSSHDHVGGRVHATDRGNAAEIRLRHGLDVIGREGPLDARFAPPTLALLLYGEVQMVVPAATLAQDFGVEADCASGRVRLLERPHGIERRRGSCHGTSAPATGRRSDRASNRDRAAPVHPSMLTGLCDGPVTDYGSTLIRSGHCSPISTAADFRGLTPIVLRTAPQRARPRLYEPYHTFETEARRAARPAGARGRAAPAGAHARRGGVVVAGVG